MLSGQNFNKIPVPVSSSYLAGRKRIVEVRFSELRG